LALGICHETLDFAFGVIEKRDSELTIKETLYWEVGENRFLKNSVAKMSGWNDGLIQQVRKKDMSKAVAELVTAVTVPVIILVHNEEKARIFLEAMGLDTSRFESGVRTLLGYTSLAQDPYASCQRKHVQDRRRSRSSSPPRDPRRRSDERDRRQPEDKRPRVHIIDIQRLYMALTDSVDHPRSFASLCKSLLGEETVGWHAGKESRHIFDMWQRMASASSLNELREVIASRWEVSKAEYEESDSSEGEEIERYGPSTVN